MPLSLRMQLCKTSLLEDFTNSYAVNILGPILVLKAAWPYLPHDRSGRIVNLSSVSSSLSFPGQTLYGGTKAALEAMTRTWGRELAERATVNVVNPGPVATHMWWATSVSFQQISKHFIQNVPLMKAREGIDEEKNMSRPLRRLVGGLAMTMNLLEWWPCSARKTGTGVQET